MPGLGFLLLSDTLTPLLARASITGVEDKVQEKAPEILDYARANAPWTDRTGAARAGLGVEVYKEGTETVLDLFHTVDYGLWLEVKNSGEYAIIMPTLEHFAKEVLDSVGAVEVGGFNL